MINVTITGNLIRDIAANRGLVVQTTNLGTVNASIEGNQFVNVTGLGGTLLRVNEGGGGTLNIHQLAPTAATAPNELDDANGLGNLQVSVGGTPQFNQAAPPLPSSPILAASAFGGDSAAADGMWLAELPPLHAEAVI